MEKDQMCEKGITFYIAVRRDTMVIDGSAPKKRGGLGMEVYIRLPSDQAYTFIQLRSL